MKTELRITTAIAAALLAGACSQQNDDDWGETAQRATAICTDRNGQRVPEANCQQQRVAGGGGAANAFLWYYLARSSVIPYYGDRVGGGSFQRSANTPYFRAPAAAAMTRATAISRGGFGASARGFGGGHGGAGE